MKVVVLAGVLVACGGSEPADVAVVVEAGGTRPTVAVAETGEVYVAWVEAGPEGGNVLLARAGADLEFGSPVQVNDVAGDAAPHEQAPAQVAVGRSGEVYVVWQNNTPAEGRRFPYSDLRFARSEDGGRTFSPAVTVNDDAGGLPSSHTFHSMAVAEDGTVLIAWIDGRARAAAEQAGGGGESGEAHHAGGGSDEPGSQIRLARSEDGGRTFEPSVLLADVACPCCRTALAVGPGGVVNVAWRDVADGDIRDVVVARSEDGGRTFGAPVVVHADGWRIGGCPHAGPSLAYDGGGRLHVGWYTGAESAAGLYHAVSEDGGRTFGEPLALLAGGWVPVSLVSLAADAEGVVWAAWGDRRVEPLAVQVGRVGEGRVESVGVVSGKAPTVAAAGRSGVVAVVVDGEVIRAARWGVEW